MKADLYCLQLLEPQQTLVQQSVNYLLRAILETGLTSITKCKLMNKELLFVRISSVRAFKECCRLTWKWCKRLQPLTSIKASKEAPEKFCSTKMNFSWYHSSQRTLIAKTTSRLLLTRWEWQLYFAGKCGSAMSFLFQRKRTWDLRSEHISLCKQRGCSDRAGSGKGRRSWGAQTQRSCEGLEQTVTLHVSKEEVGN